MTVDIRTSSQQMMCVNIFLTRLFAARQCATALFTVAPSLHAIVKRTFGKFWAYTLDKVLHARWNCASAERWLPTHNTNTQQYIKTRHKKDSLSGRTHNVLFEPRRASAGFGTLIQFNISIVFLIIATVDASRFVVRLALVVAVIVILVQGSSFPGLCETEHAAVRCAVSAILRLLIRLRFIVQCLNVCIATRICGVNTIEV